MFFNVSLKDATFAVDTADAPSALAVTPVNLVTGEPQAVDLAAVSLAAGEFLTARLHALSYPGAFAGRQVNLDSTAHHPHRVAVQPVGQRGRRGRQV